MRIHVVVLQIGSVTVETHQHSMIKSLVSVERNLSIFFFFLKEYSAWHYKGFCF